VVVPAVAAMLVASAPAVTVAVFVSATMVVVLPVLVPCVL
jgi:hypothetical protein